MAATFTRASPEGESGTPVVSAGPLQRLRVPYLERLAPGTRDRMIEVSRHVAARLDGWARRYPAVRRERVVPLALSVTAAMPAARVEDLTSVARVSLWVFTLDDRFDEGGLPLGELRQLAAFYRSVAAGWRATGIDDLAAALGEVRDDFTRFPLFAAMEREWLDALRGTIDGMLREEEWRLAYRERGRDALPQYDAYLANGRYSIGGPPHVWSGIIAVDDPAAPSAVGHLAIMEREASTAIRLANDLQSQAKELDEGKVNSLVILCDQLERAGLRPVEARAAAQERVHAEIRSGLQRLLQLQAEARTPSGRTEGTIADIARFVCEFYVAHDYHTFAAPIEAQPPTLPEVP